MKRIWPAIVALVGLAASFPAAAAHYQYTGNILTGDQFDTYIVPLVRGDFVVATAVCDPANPTLDTILYLFIPGVPATDTQLAAASNDDDPGGSSCGGFRSSRITYRAGAEGTYAFRVDGFGTATGPYTLTIDTTPGPGGIPTLGEYGLMLLGALVALVALRRLRART
jgi:hypothetical protein